MHKIKKLLDDELLKRDTIDELSLEKPDPLLVATKYKDEYISLICALFAYGNAHQIVRFLLSLDFSMLDRDESYIRTNFKNHYYRFQTREDTLEFFITLSRMKKKNISLEEVFYIGYQKEKNVIDGLKELITLIYDANLYRSKGYEFLIGKIPAKIVKSPYKRWNMYLRWMVRDKGLDFGLWKKIDKSSLLIPLDTHTFNVSKKLGLLTRKTYDFKSVILLSEKLKEFDENDPIKYDFALYRIGQEGII